MSPRYVICRTTKEHVIADEMCSLVVLRVLWHPALRRHGILSTLLLLEVILVGKVVGCGHVVGRDGRLTWYALWLLDLMLSFVGRFDLAFSGKTIFGAGRGRGCVKAGLREVIRKTLRNREKHHHLDEVLSLRLRDERLQLWRRECVH